MSKVSTRSLPPSADRASAAGPGRAAGRRPSCLMLLMAVAVVLRGGMAFVAAACLISSPTAASFGEQARPPAGEILLIPSASGNVPMRTLLFRPPGAGPFPLVIINHGTSSNAELRKLQRLSVYRGLAQWFVRRGYIAAVPQRPGHGATGGLWREDYGSCEHPDYRGAGHEIAANIEAVMHNLQGRSDVRRSGVVLVGHSAGGWGALALAHTNPRKIAAVINFAGGLGGRSYDQAGRNCAPDLLVATAGEFGHNNPVPTLWIYSHNDTYFGPDLSHAMMMAYRLNGGLVEYRLLRATGDDGHFVIGSAAAARIWYHLIEVFIRRAVIGDPGIK